MQNKGKAVKTVFIIVLVLVVLAGAVGATTVLLKRNNAEDNAPIKLVIDNFEMGHTNSDAYQFLCMPETFSRISSGVEKNGFFNIELEVKGIEEELTWDIEYHVISSDVGKNLVFLTVDEANSHKVVITIKSLDSNLWNQLTIHAFVNDSRSSIYLNVCSFEDLFGDSVQVY